MAIINYRSYFSINYFIVCVFALSGQPLERKPLKTNAYSFDFYIAENNNVSLGQRMWEQCISVSSSRFKRSSAIYNRTMNLHAAIQTMEYHRDMFKHYMVSSYLARQIAQSLPMLEMITPLQHRMGLGGPITKANILNTTDHRNPLGNQEYSTKSCENASSSTAFTRKLLQDKGSQRYLSWLYSMIESERKMNEMPRFFKDPSSHSQAFNANKNRRKSLQWQSNTNDMDGGELSFENDHQIIINDLDMEPATVSQRKKNNWYARGASNAKGYTPKAAQSATEHTVYRTHKKSSDIGLKEVADIAFTTLAYLSFGLFILQVLMCITMTRDDANSFALPMENVDNADLDGGIEEVRRRRRSILSVEEQRLITVNNISHRVLLSLKAVSQMAKDNGSCHYYLLCENNKYASEQKGAQKLWIPIWSLGVTWLAGKLNGNNETIPWSNYMPILYSMKAVLIGLSQGKCNNYYSSKCNLE